MSLVIESQHRVAKGKTGVVVVVAGRGPLLDGRAPSHVPPAFRPDPGRGPRTWGNLVFRVDPLAYAGYDRAALQFGGPAGGPLQEALGENGFQQSTFRFSAIDHPLGMLPWMPSVPGDGSVGVMARYFQSPVPPGSTAAEVRERLGGAPHIEVLHVDFPPPPPCTVAYTDDLKVATQRYLDAATAGGLGSKSVWNKYKGADGAGVKVVDVEQGWVFNHVDLKLPGNPLVYGKNLLYQDHGTAVLGILRALDNTIGVVGMAPACSLRVASQWETSTTWNTPDAIAAAAQVLRSGDVLVIESQCELSSGSNEFWPVEIYSDTWNAIRNAADKGIVVVEAAGNGGHDLDTGLAWDGKTLVVAANWFTDNDSGAVMVAAADGGLTGSFTRQYESNYGKRIDCFGWGTDVATTGISGLTTTNGYRTDFSGTSAATALVAGAITSLQGMVRATTGSGLAGPTLRTHLKDTGNGTLPTYGLAEKIGQMPNLAALAAALKCASV